MLLLGFLSLNAQTKKSDAFYFSLEASPLLGNFIGVDLSANYQLKQSVSFSLGLYSSSSIYKHLDDKYRNYGYYFKLGKVFLSKDGNLRFNLAAGVGYNQMHYPIESRKWTETIPFLFWDVTLHHTDITYADLNKVTFIFNPKVELKVSNGFGVSFSALYMTNDVQPVLGAGFGIILGS